MPQANLVLLYVADAAASARFYTDLLGRAPVEQSEHFAMIPLSDGIGLGLWSRDAVRPAVTSGAGSGEVVFTDADVDGVHRDWLRRGVTMAQPPTDMEFGRCLTALDPDGNRLRVFNPAVRTPEGA